MNLMKHQIVDFLKEALNEDIGRGDLARSLIKGETTAFVKSKSEGIVAGLEYIKYFSEIADVKFDFFYKDGSEYKNGDIIFEVYGNAKDILSIERTMLNILQHASGIASNAYKFSKIADNKIKILDTRKTRPKLRIFEKYAAFCGGITNHRLGLDDCLMLKDTHLALFTSIKEAINKARKLIPFTTKIEVECENFEMAKEAMEAGADIVMCDNMEFDEIKKVAEFRNDNFPKVLLEASGNVTLENIKKYIDTGVDAISSGAIIHHAVFKDFSMKIQ
ncbi:nicotinate-nucleotide pyrophosphorylase (carboxylating) [Lebetimonas natsushimae]|uniref:nicotinate-nucleotide diphosphorylase (carboxylating) n=1 Tax=Lebetimonas natsushimae TaxID=1936991 RepID=A0A292Y813_9BACT|nr:carboxylating nicotinate-nucleotide diphosphorylase [Lebetimonas natsushimae]GAX86912.1 nicotinate-nucleotide pyrophosphorylase (carboxylating) [Lebetimonas natsushimae]